MEEFFTQNAWVVTLIALWSIPWKGVALWKAAKKGQTGCFIAILILNTLAILEILYIFVFSKKKKSKSIQEKEELKVGS